MPPYEKPKNSYDFITKPPEEAKQKLFSLDMVKRNIPLALGGGVALIIVLFVLFSLLNSGPSNKETLLKIVQIQTEITRVSKQGTKNAKQPTMNIAQNTALSISSDKAKLVSALSNNKVNFKDKEASMGANPQTDRRLSDARSAANFDETFLQILDDHMIEYRQTLKDAYANSSNKNIKDALSLNYKHSDTLKKQLDAAKK